MNIENIALQTELSYPIPEIPDHKEYFEKRLFELLKRAYVDARYKIGYKITKKELEYLSKRVIKLQSITEKVCKAKIKSFTTIP